MAPLLLLFILLGIVLFCVLFNFPKSTEMEMSTLRGKQGLIIKGIIVLQKMHNCITNCKKINEYSYVILNISYNLNHVFSNTVKNVHFSNRMIFLEVLNSRFVGKSVPKCSLCKSVCFIIHLQSDKCHTDTVRLKLLTWALVAV